jgi:hypothetical protein
LRHRLVVAPVLLLAPALTEAHAFGARYDLPLPLAFYLVAAGVAVAVSFVAALIFLQRGAGSVIGIDIAVPPALAGTVRAVLAGFGLAVLAVVLATAVFGPLDPTKNLSTITVWVLWWVGFLLVSALVADLWPAVDPFRRAYWLAARLARRDTAQGRVPLPDAAGWLAPAGLLALGWIELVSEWSENPRALAVLMGIYLAIAVGAGLLFGNAWFRTADPLARIFSLISRVAPVTAASGGRLRLRPFGEGLVGTAPSLPGEVALVAGLIAIVMFDGISETPWWAAVLDFISESRSLRPMLLALREQGVDLLQAVETLGLIATVIAFIGLYWLLAIAMRFCSGTTVSTRAVGTTLAPSLLPIAVAYHLSHYLSYLLLAGQLAAPAVSDPFGLGWDLLGVGRRPIDIGVIGAEQVWWVAVAALVAGHSLSVVIAHRQALILFGAALPAARSQAPMLVAMVSLTMLSLWILAQPVIA